MIALTYAAPEESPCDASIRRAADIMSRLRRIF